MWTNTHTHNFLSRQLHLCLILRSSTHASAFCWIWNCLRAKRKWIELWYTSNKKKHLIFVCYYCFLFRLLIPLFYLYSIHSCCHQRRISAIFLHAFISQCVSTFWCQIQKTVCKCVEDALTMMFIHLEGSPKILLTWILRMTLHHSCTFGSSQLHQQVKIQLFAFNEDFFGRIRSKADMHSIEVINAFTDLKRMHK